MSNSKKHYKIGTRGSLLALTQCTQVKEELEALTGDEFTLEVIKTQGDIIVDRPLWQLEGKDFFTKELDQALVEGSVDLVVHSYKDLGSDRPEEFELAAITKRAYAEDILFIRKDVKEKLHTMDKLIVGTSSPRRIVNIEKSLSKYIPAKKDIAVETKMLRGNVNTRLAKLNDKQYDAIVLAWAGIERLAICDKAKKDLLPLINDLDFMILPHGDFPPAASQGALAIECKKGRNDNGELLEKLSKMNDKTTISEVQRERAAFTGYGGGCHLAVGVHVKKVGDFYLHTHRGSVDDKVISVSSTEGAFETFEGNRKNVFIGLPKDKMDDETLCDEYISKSQLNVDLSDKKLEDVFATSNYTIPALKTAKSYKALFAAGSKTLQQLTREGLWVNGSSEGLSEDYLNHMRSSALLSLFLGEKRALTALSNDEATSTEGEVVACYQRNTQNVSDEYLARLEKCEVFFWTSYHQYQEFTKLCPSIKTKFHATGLGKTFKKFQEEGIRVRAFATLSEFKEWINQ